MIQDTKKSNVILEGTSNFKNDNYSVPFNKVETLNDAGEKEFSEEDYLNDDSELSIADFIATGELKDEDDDDMEDDEDDDIITDDELDALDGEDMDDAELNDSQLDSVDEDGDLLNEENDLTGDDLDVPGADEDDEDEVIGEEDEENNSYSTSKQDI